ncbi:hypothetical protein, partial [Ancylobacter lacus]|uniref:hypothetical protein n=1 Tax=Ancylobacter lacus TaxID=2579970 RepID=UPI001BCC0342
MSHTAVPTVAAGRIVHYVLPAGSKRAGEVRPAIIVRPWSQISDDLSGLVNLHIFLDGTNDVGEQAHAYSAYYSADREPG